MGHGREGSGCRRGSTPCSLPPSRECGRGPWDPARRVSDFSCCCWQQEALRQCRKQLLFFKKKKKKAQKLFFFLRIVRVGISGHHFLPLRSPIVRLRPCWFPVMGREGRRPPGKGCARWPGATPQDPGTQCVLPWQQAGPFCFLHSS